MASATCTEGRGQPGPIHRSRPLGATLAFVLLSRAPKPAGSAAPVPGAPHPATAALVAALDPSVPACDDFYQYACGGWLRSTPLPADQPAWGRSFSVIEEANLLRLRTILEAAAKEPGADPDRQKLGALYGSCMDRAVVDTRGNEGLVPLFSEIDRVRDLPGFMAMSGRLAAVGVPGVVYTDVDADYKDPGQAILYVFQGGLSLPDRDDYLRGDERSKALLAALTGLVERHLRYSGLDPAEAAREAPRVVDLETRLARVAQPLVELWDPEQIYHRVDRAGLLAHAPALELDDWLAGAGAAGIDAFSIGSPRSLSAWPEELRRTEMPTLRAWLRFQLVHRYAMSVDEATFQADFEVFGRRLVGQEEPEAMWKRCVHSTEAAMGQALGKLYVEEAFPGRSKATAVEMIEGVQASFRAGLPGLRWMDEDTRRRALEKAALITNKVGYPDRWRDYGALVVTPGRYTESRMAANRFEVARQFARAGRPLDRGEWHMDPQRVNAYYSYAQNEMVFPAGILQPPFFSKDFPTAMNDGGIGFVMAHELVHGFDSQGRKFDGAGRMAEWWDPAAVTRFEAQTACVKRQFDAYTLPDGRHVDGERTLGENIADLGGIRVAWRAFEARQATAVPANSPGLTEAQTFFVALAQDWCTLSTPEFDALQLGADAHSPARFRVNGPLSNLPEFHAAFGCAVGTKMHPAETCEVW